MNFVRLILFAFLFTALGSNSSVFAQSLSLERVASGLASPTFATYAPGDSDRLYILQRSGAIRILNLNTGTLSTFMTVPGVDTFFEGGLLGLAFHPDFENNNLFYVNFTTSTGGGFRTRIARFTATNSDTASSATQQIVVEISQPQGNHNAGWIGFSPVDNFLYVATGDGGGGNDPLNAGQDITNQLLGKMLRLDINGDDFPGDNSRNYAIPASNPFVGVTGDDEIYLYGLRNPFRCSFDRSNGDLYIGDVGQGAREEIDVIPNGHTGGMNLGWRLREGTISTPGVGGSQPSDGINPIYDYVRTGPFGGNSVTGGTVYRGPVTALQGTYFFADFGSNGFWSFSYDGSDPSTFNGNNIDELIRWNGIFTTDVGTLNSVVAFGEDLVGNVYIVDLGGEIFRIASGFITPFDVALDSINPSVGQQESGTIAEVATSDDSYLVFSSAVAAPGQPSVQVEFVGTSPETNISSLLLNIESNVSTPHVSQTVELFNHTTNQYDQIDTRGASMTDQLTNLNVVQDATNYVAANGEVRARVSMTVTAPVLTFPWFLNVDLLEIQVTQ